MLKSRLLLTSISMILLTTLTGCFDLLGFPNIGVSHDDNWVAYLAIEPESEDDLYQLRAVNLADGTVINFSEPDQQGAFAWHPSENRIAYYNAGADDTLSIRISSIDDPTIGEDVVGSFSFPTDFFVTQMAFSPDGTQLAMSVILSEDELFDDTEEETESSAEAPTFDAAVYIANLSDGSITQVTRPGEFFPSIVTWSPAGSYLAFLAWTDSNGDGFIDISGEENESGGDITSVSVYDVATQAVTTIGDGTTSDLSPTWLDDSTLAYVALNLVAISPTEGFFIRGYDATTNSTTELATFADLGAVTLAISASPDGNQVAFVGLPIINAEAPEDAPPPPAPVYIYDIASGELQAVYEYVFDAALYSDSDAPIMDVPVWTQDGESLIVAFGNPLSSLLFTFAAGFDTEAIDSEMPALPVLLIDIATGETTTLTTEPLGSSGLLQSLIPLAGSFSDIEVE